MTTQFKSWASEEFGDLRLADSRLDCRARKMAAGLAARPGGRISSVFGSSAEREGAYRFVENDRAAPNELERSSSRAALRRAVGEEFVFVPVDGTSLNLTDNKNAKGLGKLGDRKGKARGLQVTSAIFVDRTGTPLGLGPQKYFARKKRSGRHPKGDYRDKRPYPKRESYVWVEIAERLAEIAREAGPQAPKLWLQIDRGADTPALLLEQFPQSEHWLTVRACFNRKVLNNPDCKNLREALDAEEILFTYELGVTKGKKRTARKACMEVRAAQAEIPVALAGSTKTVPVKLWVVQACEVGTCPEREKPIVWRLLTNRPVHSVEDAKLVIFGYTTRWRIEEFHKMWKSGALKIEENQLREADHIERWARLAAAVAVRLLRLSYLARTQPKCPAEEELSDEEVQVLLTLRKKRNPRLRRLRSKLTMSQAVELIALEGGYTGKSSGGPPGPLVLARGLFRIQAMADFLSILKTEAAEEKM